MKHSSTLSMRPAHRGQEINDSNWSTAIESIRASPDQGQKGSMLELFCSKVMMQDQCSELAKKYIPELVKLPDLPASLVENLQLVSQLVTHDLQGAQTFDVLIGALEASKKEPIVRVIFSDSSAAGAKLMADLQEANRGLQNRFEKVAQVKDTLVQLGTAESLDHVCNLVGRVADLSLEEADLQKGNLTADLGSIAEHLRTSIGKIEQNMHSLVLGIIAFDKGQLQLQQAHACFESDTWKAAQTLASFVEKPQITKLLRYCDTGEADGLRLTQLRDTVPCLCHSVSHISTHRSPVTLVSPCERLLYLVSRAKLERVVV